MLSGSELRWNHYASPPHPGLVSCRSSLSGWSRRMLTCCLWSSTWPSGPMVLMLVEESVWVWPWLQRMQSCSPLDDNNTHTGDINHPRFVFLLTDKVKSVLNMCGCRTRIFFKSETSEAEVNPPLFPDIFLHQTVEEEDEKSWNWNKSEIRSWASEDKNWFLVCRSFLSQHILSNLHLSKAFLCQN